MAIVTPTSKIKYNFIPYLKSFAVFLVINSHLDAYYPYSVLATGGALGNALFFVVSGFCLTDIRDTFKKWYYHRLFKIYPPTFFMAIIMFLVYTPSVISVSSIFTLIFLPTRYWFIGAMVLFYIPFYYIFVNTKETARRYFATTFFLSVLYVICYMALDTSSWVVENADVTTLSSYFRLICYFGIFITGGYLKFTMAKKKEGKIQRWFLLTMLCVVFLYVEKYLMDKNVISFDFQFANQLLVFAFAVLSVKTCLCAEKNSVEIQVF